MRKIYVFLVIIALAAISCGRRTSRVEEARVITVTIPPFAWFVEQIGGDDFEVSVLLPPGADHHIWEPLPAQISALAGSEAFIINGQLGFEHAWMDRFMQVNPGMKVLDLSREIELIGSEGLGPEGLKSESLRSEGLRSEGLGSEGLRSEGLRSEGLKSEGPGSEGLRSEGLRSEGPGEGDEHEGDDHDGHIHADDDNGHADEDHGHDHGGPDPHYWMAPSVAIIMAQNIHDFLIELNPASEAKYDANLAAVNRKISEVDSLVRLAMGHDPQSTVMIFHPALAYMGRDYGFGQVSFEDEGKSPSPARMKELIDLARDKEIKSIFIQAEYDVRNAESLSRETGAKLVIINPMNRNWPEAVIEVAKAIGSRQ